MDGEGQEKIKWPKDLQAAIWRHRIKKKKKIHKLERNMVEIYYTIIDVDKITRFGSTNPT